MSFLIPTFLTSTFIKNNFKVTRRQRSNYTTKILQSFSLLFLPSSVPSSPGFEPTSKDHDSNREPSSRPGCFPSQTHSFHNFVFPEFPLPGICSSRGTVFPDFGLWLWTLCAMTTTAANGLKVALTFWITSKNKSASFSSENDAKGSISPTFYEQLLCQFPCAKKVQTCNVSTEKLL